MQDYLRSPMQDRALRQMSSLALAHIGDAVYELMTRLLLAEQGTQTAKNLHAQTVRRVCAQAQAQAAQILLPRLTEEEAAVFRRARNAKPGSVPKSCTPGEYAQATALEALFGFLYLSGAYDRINELYDVIVHPQA